MLVGGWNYERIIYEEMPEEVNDAWDEAMAEFKNITPVKLLCEKKHNRYGISYAILCIDHNMESASLEEFVIYVINKKPSASKFSLFNSKVVRF